MCVNFPIWKHHEYVEGNKIYLFMKILYVLMFLQIMNATLYFTPEYDNLFNSDSNVYIKSPK